MRMLYTFLRVVMARFRALDLEKPVTNVGEFVDHMGRRWHAYSNGSLLPAISGGSPELDDPPPDPTPDPDPEPTPAPEPDPEPDPEPKLPKFEGDFDAERAQRAIAAERAKRERNEAKLKRERDDAKAEADELRKAQESEQEKVVRELGETKATAERDRANAERMAIDVALRDAAVEAGAEPKKVKRLLRLVDRGDITVEFDGDEPEVEGAVESVTDFLNEFPEFKAEVKDDPDPDADPEPTPEPPGGQPDRKRKPRPMTAEQAKKLAKDDPQRFNELFEAGDIPQSALAGK